MNRGGSDNRFRSQLTEKRAWKVICSHKNRLLTKNGLALTNLITSRLVGHPQITLYQEWERLSVFRRVGS